MRALIQRVSRAQVSVDGQVVGAIDAGLLVLLGVALSDGAAEAGWLARKVANLRIFADEQGLMNRSVKEAGGAALVVSQFTLYGDCRRGNRPSFSTAAPPAMADPLYQLFCNRMAAEGLRVERGVFGANMEVELVNSGPVTLLIEQP